MICYGIFTEDITIPLSYLMVIEPSGQIPSAQFAHCGNFNLIVTV